ncbi:MAG: T9SS type A sorting domain-containing protein, partial [Calditrichaceae bacterium]
NGLVAVQGDDDSPYSINAQLVGDGGTLIGPRISLGASGITPGAIPISDGTNYFLVWRDFSGNLKGQFLNTSGFLGKSITIATNVSINRSGTYFLALADTTYMVAFTKTDNYLYSQLVSTNGNLVGGQIKISDNFAREISMAYDGANFLIAWVEIIPDTDKDIYGQFISKEGSLIGSNFLIDGGPNYSDNPISLGFDGTRYLLAFHEQPPLSGNSDWYLYGRFITTTGEIEETFTICDISKMPLAPCVAFDNTNYFITWAQATDRSLYGRFYDKFGAPLDSSFVVIGPAENKLPIGGVGFGGGLYLVVATKVDSNFTDGDVYARFISPLTGIHNEKNLMPEKIALSQNYPNPFNSRTVIHYQLPFRSHITLKVFDMLGQEMAVLVNGIELPGNKSVNFSAENLSSGIYFYRLQAEGYVITKKLILIR